MKKWNKLLALLLAMVMAFGMTVTAFAEEATEPVEDTTTTETAPADETTPAEDETAEDAAPVEDETAAAGLGYTDVTEANWFYEAVAYVTEKGLVDGETETTFAPSTAMTRADLVTALYRLAGSPQVTAENPFTDVAADAEYYNAVMWAYTNGVVGGVTETTYEPDSPLQRQQIATMLYRYLNDDAAEEETAAPVEETVPAEELTPAAPVEETTETTDEAAPVEETTPTRLLLWRRPLRPPTRPLLWRRPLRPPTRPLLSRSPLRTPPILRRSWLSLRTRIRSRPTPETPWPGRLPSACSAAMTRVP